MKVLLLIFVITFMWFIPCWADAGEERLASKGASGVELGIPYGYMNFLPGVTAKVALPLEIYPWEKPRGEDVAAALRLHWGNRLMIYGGNISLGGPTSLFTTAAPSLTVNPLGNFSFPASTVTVGMPSLGGSAAPYGGAVVVSLGRGFAKDRINIWATGSEKKRFFTGFNLPFQIKKVNFVLSSAFGFWLLEEQLPDVEDDWFEKNLVYGETWLKGIVLEGRLTWTWLRFYGGGTVVEQPQGGFSYWGRFRGAVNLELKAVDLQVLTGVYGGRPDSITADGSIVRETFQAYINPQVKVNLDNLANFFEGGHLDLGLAFGTSFKNTNELQSQLFAEGKLRGGLAFSFPSFTLKFTGDWLGIPITNKNLKASLRSQEKYGGKINLTLLRLIPRANLGLWTSGYYENRGGPSKNRVVIGGGLSFSPKVDGKKSLSSQLIYSLVPKLSATTEIVFLQQGEFYSATTEAKATWNFQFPWVKVGGWVAVELKHTTQ